ncbi:MAG: type 4a pilus biogenesis protein PilO [Candidatus Hydrogenedentes bacterium]|nr:type 4a pilus biogenesis protein PilO [Candidatus Hydrogenedentota bacterium]
MLDIFKGKVTAKDWIFVGVVVFIAALVAAGGYFLLIGGERAKVEERRQELAKLDKELGEAKEIEKNIEALREESTGMTRLVDLFEKRLPEEREIPTLLQRFEKLGSELGLRVQLASIPSRKESRMETIPYKVTATGLFHQIVSFINMLERDERYLKISDLDISSAQEAGVSNATFVLSTFRFITRDAGAAQEARTAVVK